MNVPFDGLLDAALRVQGTFFCFLPKNIEAGRDFSLQACFILSCQAMSSHGGRVSSVQNCVAILQSPEKSTEGFFWGRAYAGLEGPPQAVALAMEREGTRGTPESP